jgi:multiple sugar transport system permease protein
MAKQTSIKKLKKQENLAGYLFASPWLIGLIVLGMFPILASLYISFTTYNMIAAPRWIGFENFRILFTNDSLFWKSLGNTLYHVAIAIPLGIVVVLPLLYFLTTRLKA